MGSLATNAYRRRICVMYVFTVLILKTKKNEEVNVAPAYIPNESILCFKPLKREIVVANLRVKVVVRIDDRSVT